MDYYYTYNYKLVPIEGWRRATVYQCHVLRCTWSIYHFRRAKPNTVRRLRKTMRTGRQLFTHHRRSRVKFSTLSVSILTGSSLEVNCFGVNCKLMVAKQRVYPPNSYWKLTTTIYKMFDKIIYTIAIKQEYLATAPALHGSRRRRDDRYDMVWSSQNSIYMYICMASGHGWYSLRSFRRSHLGMDRCNGGIL